MSAFAPLVGVRLTSIAIAELSSIVGSSGDLPPPSPPAEKASARQDQTGKASANDGGLRAKIQKSRFSFDSLTAVAVVFDLSSLQTCPTRGSPSRHLGNGE